MFRHAVWAMRLGAVDFLTKPVTPDGLRKAVADVPARCATPAPPPRKPAADALGRAKRELNRRDFDAADNLLRAAIELDPRSAEARYRTGVLHEQQDERDTADRPYRAALRADPGYEPARLRLMKCSNDKIMSRNQDTGSR